MEISGLTTEVSAITSSATDLLTDATSAPDVSSISTEDLDKELFDAVEKGNLEKVKELVEKGADLYVKDSDGNAALSLAVYYGKLDVVKYLIEDKHADFKVNSNDGKTPLHWAAQNGHLETVKYLVEKGQT
ncbi:MAG: Phosphocholine transferase AnkX [Wolbachia endosymbiont of Ctenocephalides orientis wCori]|nr:MAG: Phosphocholine transferase AnkX [Wolbachia endosymbiont of Ctenocephalides orientis wCori]